MNHHDEILQALSTRDQVTSQQLCKKLQINTQTLYPDLVSLVALEYITLQNIKKPQHVLTAEGQKCAKQGTPQFQIFQLASKEGVKQEVIMDQLKDNYKIGFNHAMRRKIISINEGLILRTVQEFQDEDRKKLNMVKNRQAVDKNAVTELKKRKLIEEKQIITYILHKGTNYKQKKIQLETELTSSMINDGSWKEKHFKHFNCESTGKEIQNGNLHLLMKTKQQFISILLEMGFQEMKTDRYIQTSFWNFDTLFQPQAHPARDAHDTFFIECPQYGKVDDMDYLQRTKQIHQKGGYGSIGYGCLWQQKQAYKNILRTHTTAISSQVLKRISDQKQFRPRKFFSIDRVFRNETLDQTHLAQFHQVEGFIIDKNLGLNHLIGTLKQFYLKIGIQKIWLKPTYNPYTEPSMEIYGMHPILKKKVQIGNSGIFRPEMLRPMGFPEDMSVIAWGLSLQRPTMIQFGVSNIRELFGYGVSIKKVKDSSIYCI